MTEKQILLEIKKHRNAVKARILQRFFKTGPGEYGEGDKFLGATMPDLRRVAIASREANFETIQKLLKSEFHEVRMTGLLILVYKYKKADEKIKKRIYFFYLKNTQAINNWDLVDVTCPGIVGSFLFEHQEERKVLYRLVESKNLWERRIAMLATFTLIRGREFGEALRLAKVLLDDKHDLMHKAVGWMLREVGKRDKKLLKDFLLKNRARLPRTTLRYAIEKFSSAERVKAMAK